MKKTFTLLAILLSAPVLLAQSGSQIFTASGSFIVPTAVTSVTVEVVGAGGTGGGNGGGGGGGGGYAAGVYAVTPGNSLPVTIGLGGSGSVGGTTSLSSLISATGGGNGTSVSNPNLGGGGTGGTGVNGNIVNRTGGTGGGGYWTYFGGGGAGAGGSTANGSNGGNTITYTPGFCMTPGGSGGAGGGAPGGGGGKGAGFTDNSCNNTDPSAGGSLYGGGGGGGNGNGGPAGVGANGYCRIIWGCVTPATPTNITPAANLTICSQGTATLMASATGSVVWYNSSTGTGSVGTGTTFITPSLAAGTTTFYAEALTCTNSAVRTPVTVTVVPGPSVSATSSSLTICAGSQPVLTANGASTYTWSPYIPAAMTVSTGVSTTISPLSTTFYSVTGTATNGCQGTGTLIVFVNPVPSLTLTTLNPSVCLGGTSTLVANGAQNYAWLQTGPNTPTIIPPNAAVIKPTATAVYVVAGISAAGCTSQATINITVNALPSLSVTTSRPFICKGLYSATITVTGALTYTWSTGAISNAIVTPTLLNNTTYSVTGTDVNSCNATAVFTQSVVTCIGIDPGQLTENLFKIFPNPNHGEFTISADTDLELTISNEIGQTVQTVNLNEINKHRANVKKLAAGIYFIHNANSKHIISKKVIVSD
ncbi:MAG: T9SS type A sorting domain-containing protein [Bacteroidota bacterium]